MTLDLIALGAVCLFALLGAMTGALSQTVHLLGIVAAWATARYAGFAVGPQVAHALKLPAILGVALTALFLGATVFVLVHVLGRWLVRRIRGNKGPGPVDRALGVLFGAAKSGAIVWLVLSVLVFFDRPLRGLGWKMDLSGSEAASLARSYNLMADTGLPMPELQRAINRISKSGTMRGPGAGVGAPNKVDLAALAADPRMKRLSGNAGVQAALQRGDYVTVLRNPEVLKLLADPKMRSRLMRVGAAGDGTAAAAGEGKARAAGAGQASP